jgi:predicted flavoprotein YhiN
LDKALVEAKATSRRQLGNEFAARLPQRLAAAWLDRARLDPARPLAECRDADLQRLGRSVHDWQLMPSGDEGWRKAEVMRGGVSTKDLSSQTLESRQVPGLYFIGEVVDVTGWLGGYNFQWAWASAAACAAAMAATATPA